MDCTSPSHTLSLMWLLAATILVTPNISPADELTCEFGHIEVCTDKKILEYLDLSLPVESDFNKKKLLDRIVSNEKKYLQSKSDELEDIFNRLKPTLANNYIQSIWKKSTNNWFDQADKKKPIINRLMHDFIISPPAYNNIDELSTKITKLAQDYEISLGYDVLINNIFKDDILKIVAAKASEHDFFVDIDFNKNIIKSIWPNLIKIHEISSNEEYQTPPPLTKKNIINSFEDIASNIEFSISQNRVENFTHTINEELDIYLTQYINRSLRNNSSFLKTINRIFEVIKRLSIKQKKTQNFITWKDTLVNSYHKKITRQVYIVNAYPIQPPVVDRYQGNLFIHKDHLHILQKKGLLKYLMMHEAVHVYTNGLKLFENNLSTIKNFSKDLPSLVEEIQLSIPPEEREIFEVSTNTEDKNKLKIFYENYFDYYKSKLELTTDLNVLDSLPLHDQNNYINMLDTMLPNYAKGRLKVLKDYLDTVRNIEKTRLSNEDLFYAFIIRAAVNFSNNKHFANKEAFISSSYQNSFGTSAFAMSSQRVSGDQVSGDQFTQEEFSLPEFRKELNTLLNIIKDPKSNEQLQVSSIVNKIFNIKYLEKIIDDTYKNQLLISNAITSEQSMIELTAHRD